MSDFTSNFWSVYISAIVLLGILGCLALLWISGSTKSTHAASDNTTGHVWDGDLREMNNPLPRWWVGLFIITCLFGLAYLFLYPGLGSYGGSLKWTSHGQFDQEMARGDAQIAPIYAAFAGKSIPDLSKDPQAMAIGDRLFMNNCSQCHGSDARGGPGFPNLTDKYWTWGGTPEEILQTITKGRTGIMTPMAAALGSPDDIRNVANYALSLSNSPHDAARAAQGKAKFETVCAACHGADGTGNKLLGSANLTKGVFIHGAPVEAHVLDMINNGKTGVMPAWESKFTPDQLRVLAAYVWGKGGGENEAAPAAAAAPAPAAADDAYSVSTEGDKVVFLFPTGETAVRPGSETQLAVIVDGVKAGKKAVISGYVDSTGTPERNAEIAKQRAESVRDQLVALGVAADKIELQKPADIQAGTGASARRVEVTVQ